MNTEYQLSKIWQIVFAAVLIFLSSIVEAPAVQTLNTPILPSKAVQEDHKIDHYPYAEWCDGVALYGRAWECTLGT